MALTFGVIPFALITCTFDYVLTLQGEFTYWSLVGLKGLMSLLSFS